MDKFLTNLQTDELQCEHQFEYDKYGELYCSACGQLIGDGNE